MQAMDPESEQVKPLSVGVLVGSDDVRDVTLAMDVDADISGNSDGWRLVDACPVAAIRWNRLHLTPSHFRRGYRWDPNRFDVVLNLISDPDQNPKTLAVAERLLRGVGRPVLNPPAAMAATTRDRIAKRLANLPDVIMPRTERIPRQQRERAPARLAEQGFRFPAILRRVGTHTGRTIATCGSATELAARLRDTRDDHYLTEFHDFRSADGLFRKYRFFCIGGSIVLRHMIVSDQWNIHAKERKGMMREREDLHREEERLFTDGVAARFPRAWAALHRVRQTIGLDYFGIDCNLTDDDRVVIFEVNATMNFFPVAASGYNAYTAACRPRAVTAMEALLLAQRRPAAAGGPESRR